MKTNLKWLAAFACLSCNEMQNSTKAIDVITNQHQDEGDPSKMNISVSVLDGVAHLNWNNQKQDIEEEEGEILSYSVSPDAQNIAFSTKMLSNITALKLYHYDADSKQYQEVVCNHRTKLNLMNYTTNKSLTCPEIG